MKREKFNLFKLGIIFLLILVSVIVISRLDIFNQPIKGVMEEKEDESLLEENSNEEEDIELKLEAEELNRRKRMQLELEIKEYMASKSKPYTDISIGYYNLENKEEIIINGDKNFPIAAGLSIPLNMIIYDMHQAESLNINTNIKTIESDYDMGFGSLKEIEPGTSLNLSRLLSQSLVEGDNISRNILKRQIKESSNLDWWKILDKEYGIKISKDGSTSIEETLNFMKMIFEGENNYYNKIISDMKRLDNRSGGLTYISSRIDAGNRIGLSNSQKSEIGFIFHEKNYIYIIFLDNDEENSFPDIGSIIFKWHNYYN